MNNPAARIHIPATTDVLRGYLHQQPGQGEDPIDPESKLLEAQDKWSPSDLGKDALNLAFMQGTIITKTEISADPDPAFTPPNRTQEVPGASTPAGGGA